MRVAFSHDWLNGMRGGEKCLEALCDEYPASPIFTLFFEPKKISGALLRHPITPSFLQRLPGSGNYYRYYLPFFSKAMEAFKLDACDVVVSMSHCVAKGIRKPVGAKHVTYCFTPMRYAWGFFEDYFGTPNPFVRKAIERLMKNLRQWDLDSNKGVDHFVAISEHVRKRIAQFYDRESEVIYPPVDTDFFTPGTVTKTEDYYLIVSALVPYKRIGLAVESFNRLKKKLVIIGDGPLRSSLEKMAGPTIEFKGWQPDEVIRDHYRRAKALVFPGEEDFGIVPVEVQACGRFVIGYKKGGILETVLDSTGVFFEDAAPESLCEAVTRFEALTLDPGEARHNAVRFRRDRFKQEMKAMIERVSGGKKSPC